MRKAEWGMRKKLKAESSKGRTRRTKEDGRWMMDDG
jgi:hypothetical protein